MNNELPVVTKRRNSIIKRSLMMIALLLTALHLFATFLWVAPPSNLRQLVPGNLLTQYMIPLWGQSWSVFAPEPINGDYYFDVRAVIETDDGTEKVTQWVRATDVELSHSTYKLFPPRSAGLGIGVASDLKGAWEDLSDDHKSVVGLDFHKGEDPTQRLRSKLNKHGDSEKRVLETYMDAELTATAYATQVASAIWKDSVVRVQFQASRKNVVPYAQRNNPTAQRPPIQLVPTGWRALTVEKSQSGVKFADYFCSSEEVRCVGEQ